jgi:hypothetical protein
MTYMTSLVCRRRQAVFSNEGECYEFRRIFPLQARPRTPRIRQIYSLPLSRFYGTNEDERLRGGGLHSQWPQFYESEPRFGPRRRICSCGNDGCHLAWSGKRSHGVWSQFTPTACWAWCWGNLWWFFNDRIQVQRIDLITNTTREVWTKLVQNCYATYLPRSWSSARRLAYQITYYGHLGAIMGVGCDGMP